MKSIACSACGRRFSPNGLRDHARDKGAPHGQGIKPPPRDDDESEIVATWRALHVAHAAKRAANREASPEILARAGVAFESKNFGAHLIIEHGGRLVDFWPGTGLWIDRESRRRARGVKHLLKHLGATIPPEPIQKENQACTA